MLSLKKKKKWFLKTLNHWLVPGVIKLIFPEYNPLGNPFPKYHSLQFAKDLKGRILGNADDKTGEEMEHRRVIGCYFHSYPLRAQKKLYSKWIFFPSNSTKTPKCKPARLMLFKKLLSLVKSKHNKNAIQLLREWEINSIWVRITFCQILWW